MSRFLNHAEHDAVHHFHRRRRDGSSRELGHRCGSIVRSVVDRQQRLHRLAGPHQPDNDLGHQSHRSLGTGQQPCDVIPRQVLLLSTDLQHSAVRQNSLYAQHVVGGHAVDQRVRATGILGNVATDGAGLLRRRVRRVIVPVSLNGASDVQVHNTGLDHGAFVLEIDLENLVHARETNHDPAPGRDHAAAQSSAGSPPHDGEVVVGRDAHDLNDVFGAPRKDHAFGTALIDAAVVLVQQQVLVPVQDGTLANGKLQGAQG